MLFSLVDFSFLFFFSLSSLLLMRKFAKKINLIDTPSKRKYHQGAIPLAGGLSITLSLLYFLFNNPSIIPHVPLYVGFVVILAFTGALDDKFDVSAKWRLFVQGMLSITMMTTTGIGLYTLGDIFGIGEVITLGWLGYLVTMLAVMGAINAFNMVDGIDGLLGGLSTVTFGGLGIILAVHGQTDMAYLCFVLVVIILPYILLNLGTLGRSRKVFMGDAGSMVIGFTVIWLLLLSSQSSESAPLRPVTALWLIALPLMDMMSIMIRRIRRGDSPLKPDREHLHHICQRLGLSASQTLVFISSIASLCACIGIYAEINNVPEYVMFYSFIACFVIYLTLLNHVWVVTTTLRRWRQRSSF